MASESASHAFMAHAKELVDKGQFGKAIAVLQEGLKKFPKMVSARVLLGEIYRTSGDLALARTELEQVIKAAPDNFAAYRKLALVYRDLGDKPAALKACETDRKSTRLNSSHVRISYAVFCLKKKSRGDRLSSFLLSD